VNVLPRSGSLSTATLPGEVAALILRALSSVTINISLMLYVMDFIPRQQMHMAPPNSMVMPKATRHLRL